VDVAAEVRGRPLTRAVLFDADHTLLDFDRAQRAALAQTMRAFELPYSPAVLRTYRAINDELWEAMRRGEMAGRRVAVERFRRLLRHFGRDPRRAPALGRAFLEQLSRRGDLMPGCRRMLRTLSGRYRLGVVTNGYDRVQRRRLAAARLDGLFEVVVTSEGSGFVKPDPRILGVALAALGLQSREVVYVGDDLRVDGGAARNAGVPFCWVDRGLPPPAGLRAPRLRVRSLSDILRVL
jgi:2-haloacid dehalogenase